MNRRSIIIFAGMILLISTILGAEIANADFEDGEWKFTSREDWISGNLENIHSLDGDYICKDGSALILAEASDTGTGTSGGPLNASSHFYKSFSDSFAKTWSSSWSVDFPPGEGKAISFWAHGVDGIDFEPRFTLIDTGVGDVHLTFQRNYDEATVLGQTIENLGDEWYHYLIHWAPDQEMTVTISDIHENIITTVSENVTGLTKIDTIEMGLVDAGSTIDPRALWYDELIAMTTREGFWEKDITTGSSTYYGLDVSTEVNLASEDSISLAVMADYEDDGVYNETITKPLEDGLNSLDYDFPEEIRDFKVKYNFETSDPDPEPIDLNSSDKNLYVNSEPSVESLHVSIDSDVDPTNENDEDENEKDGSGDLFDFDFLNGLSSMAKLLLLLVGGGLVLLILIVWGASAIGGDDDKAKTKRRRKRT